jgi:hypothetical protein
MMAQQVSVRHFLLSWTHSAPVTRVRHLRQRFQQCGADRICGPRRDGGNDGQVTGYQADRRR